MDELVASRIEPCFENPQPTLGAAELAWEPPQLNQGHRVQPAVEPSALIYDVPLQPGRCTNRLRRCCPACFAGAEFGLPKALYASCLCLNKRLLVEPLFYCAADPTFKLQLTATFIIAMLKGLETARAFLMRRNSWYRPSVLPKLTLA